MNQNKAIYAGTYGKVSLFSPLVLLTKSKVIKLGLRLSKPVPYELTYSCYNGVNSIKGCGTCATCIERYKAFEENGLDKVGRLISK